MNPNATPAPPPPPRPAASSLRTLFILAAVVGVVYLLRWVLLPFVIAAAIAILLEPLIRLARRRLAWPRWLLGLLAFAAFLLALTLAALALLHWGLPEFQLLSHQLPAQIQSILKRLMGDSTIHIFGQTFDANSLAASLQQEIQTRLTTSSLLTLAGDAVAASIGAILAIVLTLYFLLQGPSLLRGAFALLPPRRRPFAAELARRSLPILWRYFGGVALVILYASLLTWLVISLLGIHHAFLCALLVGFLELIPVLGPIASALLIATLAMARGDTASLFGLAAFALALRLSIDQIVGPLVLGKAVQVPAPVIIFAMLAGGAIWGILGIILAVPLAAIIRLAIAMAYADPPPAAAPPTKPADHPAPTRSART